MIQNVKSLTAQFIEFAKATSYANMIAFEASLAAPIQSILLRR